MYILVYHHSTYILTCYKQVFPTAYPRDEYLSKGLERRFAEVIRLRRTSDA